MLFLWHHLFKGPLTRFALIPGFEKETTVIICHKNLLSQALSKKLNGAEQNETPCFDCSPQETGEKMSTIEQTSCQRFVEQVRPPIIVMTARLL